MEEAIRLRAIDSVISGAPSRNYIFPGSTKEEKIREAEEAVNLRLEGASKNGQGSAHGEMKISYCSLTKNMTLASLQPHLWADGDVQYMKDSMAVGDSPKGWIFGLRLTAEF